MIRINLLPEELRPIKRTPLPYLVSSAVLIGACVLMALMFLSGWATIQSKKAEYAKNEEEFAALKAVVEESNALDRRS